MKKIRTTIHTERRRRSVPVENDRRQHRPEEMPSVWDIMFKLQNIRTHTRFLRMRNDSEIRETKEAIKRINATLATFK